MGDMETVLEARDAKALFGANEKRAKITYRRLARAVHPDMFPEDDDKAKANKAFHRLTAFWEDWNGSASGNSTASGKAANGAHKATQDTFSTLKREYLVTARPTTGDPFFKRLEVSYASGDKLAEVLITSAPGNADLADNHVTSLRRLAEEVPEEFRGFYPEIVETFIHADGNVERRGIIQSRFDGFVPFSNILEVYPEGVSGRDVAWMFRRMLVAVGNAHDLGLAHGAVSMESFSIHPEQHGVVLGDWQYSVEIGEKLKAVPQALKPDYPEYALNGETVGSSLDINLCAAIANKLLEVNGPRQMRNFFKVCAKRRTLSASVLLREFDLLLRNLYGVPKFNPFTLNT